MLRAEPARRLSGRVIQIQTGNRVNYQHIVSREERVLELLYQPNVGMVTLP